MCGAAHLSGSDEEHPVRFQAPWVDFGTGLHLALGKMAWEIRLEHSARSQLQALVGA